MENTKTKKDVYAIVTDRIINLLEKGTVPWRQPWTEAGQPCNLYSGKFYKGINIMLLASLGYAKNYFLTEKQIQELGATIKEKEKPHIVVFWNWQPNGKAEEGESETTQAKQNTRPLLRYYRVFNVSQCEGIPKDMIPAINRPNNPIEACEETIKGMPNPPVIRNDHNQAYYDRIEDIINIPEIGKFESSEAYYNTLYHETVHATGHEYRLNRPEVAQSTSFGTPAYSKEELTAEIAACFLCSITGIAEKVEKNSVAYIENWLKVLKNDRKFIIYASSNAQKAVDYILNSNHEDHEGREIQD
ncbi:zincin-like metallopeptidase domain-containing protein [soil metagenome]